MLITTRKFETTTQLTAMIDGFHELFGVRPDVRIEVRNRHGGPSSTSERGDGELLFFPASGFRLFKVARKFITVIVADDEKYVVDPSDQAVSFVAAFYLP